jgi:acetyl-CoA carboxylase, biotin carboxylase subunit
MKIKKILIANRGEIASRIIKTCKKMGIETVAIFSDIDKFSPYVLEADESYLIGRKNARDSYLNIDQILNIAEKAQVDAIHPGYGFLSENYLFAEACELKNIKFIGPQSEIIQTMGSKIEARKIMEKNGVPIVPGYSKKIENNEEAIKLAREIGFPLIIKASAGGGGIGMSIISNEEELIKNLQLSKQRAQISFGNGDVFLEKYIRNSKHIEVQIVGDNFGNVIHLFERECSVQRRNQKVIEESPSPYISKELRDEICNMAVKGCKALDYNSVGTVEFIFDLDTGDYYFLEMNTRLQVEHPVTEEITGLDIIELQINIAANKNLEIQQNDITIKGHAIETRLYAEDPESFVPSPGKITSFKIPENGTRFDFGIEEGSIVSPLYDAMVGKIIVCGKDRNEAIKKLQNTLKEIEVKGIKTNLKLLVKILSNEQFKHGNYSTALVNQVNQIEVRL